MQATLRKESFLDALNPARIRRRTDSWPVRPFILHRSSLTKPEKSFLQTVEGPQRLRFGAEARGADRLLRRLQADAAEGAVLAVPIGKIAAEGRVVRTGEVEL